MTVTDEDMMQVVAKWTGIPLKRMEAGEIQRLLDMENELSRIVTQKEGVTALCKAFVALEPT